MKTRQKETARLEGGTGGGNVTTGGTDLGRPCCGSPSSDVYYRHVDEIVNPFPGPIPVAAGGPIAWAACDGIFSLAHELVARGLLSNGPDLDAAIWAAWMAMGQASYLKRKDRKAWPETLEEVGQ